MAPARRVGTDWSRRSLQEEHEDHRDARFLLVVGDEVRDNVGGGARKTRRKEQDEED